MWEEGQQHLLSLLGNKKIKYNRGVLICVLKYNLLIFWERCVYTMCFDHSSSLLTPFEFPTLSVPFQLAERQKVVKNNIG